MVENHECGLFANPLYPEDLILQIKKLESDNDLFLLFSKKARSLAENKYDKDILIPKVINVIEQSK